MDDNEVPGWKGICYWQGSACEVSRLNRADGAGIVSLSSTCRKKTKYWN